jgi:hypothetical protein
MTLPELVKMYFQWGIGISALLAGVSFAVGAVQYAVSAASATVKSSAKDRMINSLIGMVILLGSIVILNTINPEIRNLGVSPLASNLGIYYSTGSPVDDKTAPTQDADTSIVKNLGYKELKYNCFGGLGLDLLVWFYPEKNFKDSSADNSGTKIVRIPCGSSRPIQGLSLKITFRYPGVYFFTKDNCQGSMSEVFSSSNVLPADFAGKAKSMIIINDVKSNKILNYYGVILHQNSDLNSSGICTTNFYTQNNDGQCYSIKIPVNSAQIYNIKTETNQSLWINLYSKPWGWKTGSLAGEVNGFFTGGGGIGTNSGRLYLTGYQTNPSSLNFDYCDWTRLALRCEYQEYQDKCKTFKDCPGSIFINGSLLVVFYEQRGNTNNPNFSSVCQSFSKNINSIKETEFMATGKQLGDIKLIPYK